MQEVYDFDLIGEMECCVRESKDRINLAKRVLESLREAIIEVKASIGCHPESCVKER